MKASGCEIFSRSPRTFLCFLSKRNAQRVKRLFHKDAELSAVGIASRSLTVLDTPTEMIIGNTLSDIFYQTNFTNMEKIRTFYVTSVHIGSKSARNGKETSRPSKSKNYLRSIPRNFKWKLIKLIVLEGSNSWLENIHLGLSLQLCAYRVSIIQHFLLHSQPLNIRFELFLWKHIFH